jgi:RimJ/RimL family protein N-acetyltransferase
VRRPRWRALGDGEIATTVDRLERWPCEPGGAVRHMFALSVLETHGARPIRIATDDERWAVAVVFPGRLVVPCGDPEVAGAAGPPTRRWRLLVGDAAAAEAVLDDEPDPGLRVHVQRFMTVERDRVPGPHELADPGLRRARGEDVEALAELAVRLHVDDRFGPDPGRAGRRGYAKRISEGVERGSVYCVGPVGAPTVKVERSVASRRYGVQLAGIVVAPEARGQGLGTAAVAAAVRGALDEWPGSRPVSLHVRADNTTAIRTYERAGFVDREEWRLAVRA